MPTLRKRLCLAFSLVVVLVGGCGGGGDINIRGTPYYRFRKDKGTNEVRAEPVPEWEQFGGEPLDLRR